MGTVSKAVLLIDDSEFLAFCFAEYLTARGFYVEVCASVPDAYRKLRTFRPDMIVLEIGVGETDGVGFLKQLLGADGKLAYPVIVHTLRLEMEQFCRQIGVDDFVPKTGYGDTLLDALTGAFLRRTQAVKAEVTAAAGTPAAAAEKKGLLLLAEDDPSISKTIRRALEAAGFEVQTVTSGKDLLHHIQVSSPRAIVLKDVLSGMNGRTVAYKLFESETFRTVPIILYDKTGGLDEAMRWQKLPRNIKGVLFTDEATLIVQSLEKNL